MNEQKFKRILAAAREETCPSPPDDFAAGVIQRISREKMKTPVSLGEQLNGLFPRLAFGSLTLIALCVGFDLSLTAMNFPEITDGVSQIAGQWLLPITSI
jgi:hypothetical protein